MTGCHLGGGDRRAHGLEVAELATRMTSGSSRRAECRAAENEGACAPTSRWLMSSSCAGG